MASGAANGLYLLTLRIGGLLIIGMLLGATLGYLMRWLYRPPQDAPQCAPGRRTKGAVARPAVIVPAERVSKTVGTVATLLVLFGVLANAQPVADPIKAIRPVSNDMLLHPDPSDWLMWRRTYDGYGFSPLSQITRDNVKDLQVAWTWSLTNGATEIEPIVHDGVLYIWSFGDRVQALNAATGDLIWEYRRKLPPNLGSAKRNMAFYQDKLLIATSDAHLVALDAKTGKVAWDDQVADWKEGWSFTSGPIVADGVVVQGMSGCGSGQRGGCFITGHDFKTGAEKWRLWTIAHPGDPNSNTWNGLPLEQRFGGSAWIAGTFDPEQHLLFFGTGQPYPWIAEMRGMLPLKVAPGITNNGLYTDSTLAIDPATGKLKWYYQHLPNDDWDMDHVFERMLIDLPFNGTMRKMVISTGKIGIIEALDRVTGEWLWARETIPQNIVASIDPKTGAKTINQAVIPHVGQTTMNCPADAGGRNWPATAYNPNTQTLFLPLNQFCSYTTPLPLPPGQTYTGGGYVNFSRAAVPGSDDRIGRIDAIRLTDRKTVWSFRERAQATTAVLPTAGGVVFAGSWDRMFRAFDDATGKVLWQIRMNNGVNGFPISYSVNGRQYVAVAAGNGSGEGKQLSTLTPEIALPDGGSVLWVFALPDRN